MSSYLMIQSRDPYAHATVAEHADLAVRLKQAGHGVAVYLVQNGVLPARADAQNGVLARLLDSHVDVIADGFSLQERGIDAARLQPGVRQASIGLVVDRMLCGWTVVWH